MALKKFLFRYPLEKGCKLFVPFIVLIDLVCIVLIVLQVLDFRHCTNYCSDFVLCSTYAFSATGLIFCICMIFIHIWFYIMGVMKRKASVVLCWMVITSIWLMEAFILTITLISISINYTSLTIFTLCICGALLAFAVCTYGVLIGHGYWRELKTLKTNPDSNN